jgi:hypothetical protein
MELPWQAPFRILAVNPDTVNRTISDGEKMGCWNLRHKGGDFVITEKFIESVS